MPITIIGNIDRNWSIDQAIKERPRHGADFIDLRTGLLVNVTPDIVTVKETVTVPSEPKEEVSTKKKKYR